MRGNVRTNNSMEGLFFFSKIFVQHLNGFALLSPVILL
jgi:hypothetical protein